LVEEDELESDLAAVKVRVKYWSSSVAHTDTII
jgi:hypothetical protein